jgi:hypothetical protein
MLLNCLLWLRLEYPDCHTTARVLVNVVAGYGNRSIRCNIVGVSKYNLGANSLIFARNWG